MARRIMQLVNGGDRQMDAAAESVNPVVRPRWTAPGLPVAICGQACMVVAVGCSGEGSSARTTEPGPQDAAVRDARSASPGCGMPTAEVGETEGYLEHGGASRRYLLHVPPAHDGVTALPLVISFHGMAVDPENQRDLTRMSELADQRGFIVAYPEGTTTDYSWNASLCCGDAMHANVDDVGFARALVAELGSVACVDRRRVYATGNSNGGFMAFELACKAADLFAAVAPSLAVPLTLDDCRPSRPVPILAINGTDDPLVPVGGLECTTDTCSGPYPPVQQGFEAWGALDECTGAPTETWSGGTSSCTSFTECAGGVTVTECLMGGAGHCYPGPDRGPCFFGTRSEDLDGSVTIADFLLGFELPSE